MEQGPGSNEISHHMKSKKNDTNMEICDILLRDGTLLSTSHPYIMGVLNVTPDSFSDGGKYLSPDIAVAHGMEMILQGARIIDVGGESTRPFSEPVSVDEELHRVIPVIRGLRDNVQTKALDAIISIDTRKPEVAEKAILSGAEMLNDISALRTNGMVEIAAKHNVPVVLMHMKGTPETMQVSPSYDDVIGEIMDFLRERMEFALSSGVRRERIIMDPGIGFGKTREHNLTIMNRLNLFTLLGQPILVGTSNKSFIGKTLNLPVDDRLEGTLATVALSVWHGASIIRVHEVMAAKRVMDMIHAIKTL